jgi:hypothetical protein
MCSLELQNGIHCFFGDCIYLCEYEFDSKDLFNYFACTNTVRIKCNPLYLWILHLCVKRSLIQIILFNLHAGSQVSSLFDPFFDVGISGTEKSRLITCSQLLF